MGFISAAFSGSFFAGLCSGWNPVNEFLFEFSRLTGEAALDNCIQTHNCFISIIQKAIVRGYPFRGFKSIGLKLDIC